MRFRYTMEELKEYSDNKMLLALVNERLSELNYYSPLAKRLKKIKKLIEDEVQKEEKEEGEKRWKK